MGLDAEAEKLKYGRWQQERRNDVAQDRSKRSTVVRTAAKAYSEEESTPSSRVYTTRKQSFPEIAIGRDGVRSDYNHYRTVALHSTLDRALSLLTADVLQKFRSEISGGFWKSISDGDLGENIFVDGVDYTFFEIGKMYKFHPPLTEGGGAEKEKEKDEVRPPPHSQ